MQWSIGMNLPLDLPSYVAGRAVHTTGLLRVYYPYMQTLTGTVALLEAKHIEEMVQTTLQGGPPLSRYQRFEILEKARRLLAERADDFANLIRLESGLCMKET